MLQTTRPIPPDYSPANNPPESFALRRAEDRDLGQINEIISAAMNTWQLSERVKRLSLPLYQYRLPDFNNMDMVVAETEEHELIGVAALEPAAIPETTVGTVSALLHGIYVAPEQVRRGIGSRLLDSVQSIAESKGFEGLLVKAHPGSISFFEASGFEKLPIEDQSRDYPYRYWKAF